MLSDEVLAIQRAYPRIWSACHVRHRSRSPSDVQPTEREASILAHLDPQSSSRAGELARHLGIRPSTLSAALEELERRGFISRRRSPRDRRAVDVQLTEAGRRAVSAASPLDERRVGRMLAKLSPRDRAVAVRGLALLARAALELQQEGR